MPVEVPQLINIADLKATPRKATLIHCSSDQWKQATKGAEKARSLPKGHAFIEYMPLPDDTGVIIADCGAPGPDEICSVRPVIDRPVPPPGPEPGPGPGPDPFVRGEGLPIRWECTCRSRGGRRPPVVVSPPCELIVERTPRLRIRCRSVSCNKRCNLRLVQVNGRWRIACVCS